VKLAHHNRDVLPASIQVVSRIYINSASFPGEYLTRNSLCTQGDPATIRLYRASPNEPLRQLESHAATIDRKQRTGVKSRSNISRIGSPGIPRWLHSNPDIAQLNAAYKKFIIPISLNPVPVRILLFLNT